MSKGIFSGKSSIILDLMSEKSNSNKERLCNGDFVKHFKRETLNVLPDESDYVYQIIELDAKNADNPKEDLTIYRALYGNRQVWIRKKSEFLSEVDKKKYQDIKQKYRFEKLSREEEDLIIGGLFDAKKENNWVL